MDPLNESSEATPNDEKKAQLEAFTAEATLKYSIKDYDAAAELYSQATELQAQINGEMSPLNADLLYAYGRCLYHVGLRHSDVLGSKVAGEAREEGSKGAGSKKQKKKGEPAQSANGETRTAEEVLARVVEENEEKDGADEEKGEAKSDKKPFFTFTGDENFDDSDEDQDDANGDGGDDAEVDEVDEEDDFANAYEVLDLARVLLLKRIEELRSSEEVQEGKGKGKVAHDSEDMRQLKERLADTHDLQAEISLEGERFPNAVTDLRAALALKEELFPPSSSLNAEAHYKLSLALEFSSVTSQKDPNGEAGTGSPAHVDETMREEAANEMKAAISSCRLRIQEEEAKLSNGSPAKEDGKAPKLTKADIDDVRQMVHEMEQRVRAHPHLPPIRISKPTNNRNHAAGRDPPTSRLDQRSDGHHQPP